LPLIEDVPALESALDEYRTHFEAAYLAVWRNKLGLRHDGDTADDFARINALVDCFSSAETDMTIFFRLLGKIAATSQTTELALESLAPAFYTPPSTRARERWYKWLADWQAATDTTDADRIQRMNAANPWIIPRNWLAQEAINAAEQGDMSVLARLMTAIRDPYTERAEYADLAVRRPDWARNSPGCSALSCSS